MAVTSTTTSLVYSGSGSLTTFPVSFKFFAASDLVITVSLAGGTPTTKVLGTDFTASGAGLPEGSGSITFTVAPPSGSTVKISRATSPTQSTSLPVQGPFAASAVEASLDKRALVEQEILSRVTAAEAAISTLQTTGVPSTYIASLASVVLADTTPLANPGATYSVISRSNGGHLEVSEAGAAFKRVAKEPDQSIVTGVSTLTPALVREAVHHVTLTAPLTIANPVVSGDAALPGGVGTKVSFVFTQDATGYRMVTFGANYTGGAFFQPRQGPGQRSSIQFHQESDGTFTVLSFDGIDTRLPTNPFNWGALGIGTVDDWPALQKAANYAASQTPDVTLQFTPNHIDFPQGEFALSQPLKLPYGSIRLTGKGMEQTLLTAFSDKTGIADWGGPMIIHQQETVKLARAGIALGTNLLTGSGNAMSLDPTLATTNHVFLAFTHDAPSLLDMNYHTQPGGTQPGGGSDFAVEFAMWIDPTDTAAIGNPVFVIASSGQPYPSGDFVTNLFRITLNRTNATQYTLGASIQLDSGLATVVWGTPLVASTTYRICLQFTQSTNAVTLFVEGTGLTTTVAAASHPVQHPFESIQVGDRICSTYPYGNTDTTSFKGRIDGIKVSCVSRYASNYSPASTKPTFDGYTLFLLNFDTFYGQMPVAYGSLTGYGGQTRLYLVPRGPGITNNDFFSRCEIKDIGLFGRAANTGIQLTSSNESRIENVRILGCYRGVEIYENSFIGEVHNVHVEMASQAGTDSHTVASKEAFLFYGADGFTSLQDCYALGGSAAVVASRPGLVIENLDHAIGQDVIYSLMFYHADEFDNVNVRGYAFDLEGGSTKFKCNVMMYAIRTASFQNCTFSANGVTGLPNCFKLVANAAASSDTLSLFNCVALPNSGATIINVVSGSPSIVCNNFKTLYGTPHTFTNAPNCVVTLGGEKLPGTILSPQVIASARTTVADANYTATIQDHRIVYTSIAAARTVTLPVASTVPTGQRVLVKDESGAVTGTFTITVSVASAGTIDGAASKAIAAAYGVLRLYSNGAQWMTE